MNEIPGENYTKTVLELDLASYSDIARALEENLDVHAVKAFEDQVQQFVDQGLACIGLPREGVVLGSAGDNAILVFDDAGTMHRFAEAVQKAVVAHNRLKSVEWAKRWFRMGAATGPILLLHAERRLVGVTVTRAVRLETAAENGQLLVDVATYNLMSEELRASYGEEERISGKRDESFLARRCSFEPSVEPSDLPTIKASALRRRRYQLSIILGVAVIVVLAGVFYQLWPTKGASTGIKGESHDGKKDDELHKKTSVVPAKDSEIAVKKETPKLNTAYVVTMGKTTVNNPAALELNSTGKAILETNASAYAAVRLAAGTNYSIILDIRQGRSTNILGTASLLDEEGAEISRNLINFNEIDHQFRRVAKVSIKTAGKYIVRVTNSGDNNADFWVTVTPVTTDPPSSLTVSDFAKNDLKKPGLVPLFGDMLPERIQPRTEVTGQLDAGDTAYYFALLPKGEYKTVVGLTHTSGKSTNIQGYLALLDGDGGGQKTIVPFNEIDVTARKSGGFTLKEPDMVILRVQVEYPMNYTLLLRPVTE